MSDIPNDKTRADNWVIYEPGRKHCIGLKEGNSRRFLTIQEAVKLSACLTDAIDKHFNWTEDEK